MSHHYKIITTILILIPVFVLSSCATIFKGGHAEVRFNSSPAGADILIDEINKGETPTSAMLARGESHIVTFQMEGYEDVKVKINKKFDAATTIIGNIFSWALLGIVVDIASGAAYSLTPADLQANMKQLQEAGIINPDEMPRSDKNSVHVFMLTAEQWELISGAH